MPLDRSTLSILVVEDEALLRLDLVETLNEAGYEVLEASDAGQALGYLRNRRPIDVVITDIDLGAGPTGWDVAQTFRAARSDIPIIYISGVAGDRRRRVPGSVFFAKPCRTLDVLKVCGGLCGAGSHRQDWNLPS
ncbi:MAG TPA: response regulator [Candidatus Acidoferrum sp.]|nr:response regulator [Candidatus Acidoferrum sp.]